jgi:membrane-bound lytic murein transglycosylase A
MQGIQAWARANPGRLRDLLNANPSYVFFREAANSPDGPVGALGVPLTTERSIAVDPRSVPLGAPVFLATTRPNSTRPLNRLVLAQDTGSAIKGAVRADFFWGFGKEAGEQAGRMKQSGRMWVLLPPEAAPK